MQTQSKESIRLFENPVLEMLTHVHPATPALIWVPVVLYFVYRTGQSGVGLLAAVVMALCGLFVWTISEYLLHRYVFHYNPTSAWGKRLIHLFHGIHHDDPEDATRLVIPPLPGVIGGAFFYFLFSLVLGPSHRGGHRPRSHRL